MKCMKRDIRERITATKTAKQCRNRNSADCPVDRSFSDNSVQPSLPESPPGDRYQQSAIVSAPWMSSLLPGTGLQLDSSRPAQSVSPTPSASTPGGSGRSTPSTQPYCEESASQTSHIGDGTSKGNHKACDTATVERNEPDSPDATQHTDDQTNASHNEVIISLLRRTDGVTKAAREDSVLNDVSKVDSADCTEETFRTCDWGTNSDLEAGHGNVVKMEKSDTLYPDVDEMNGNMVKSEEGDSHYVDVVKSEGDISQYIDAQLSAGSQRNATTPSRRQRKPKRLWKCNSCWTVCLSRSALKIHDRVHTGVKPYTCDTCGRSFAQTSCLKTHARTHTGEKPFMCTSCGKSYGASSELKIHERTHRGEKPYLCATCGKSFVSSSNLRQHETTHVLVRMYMCPTCDKSFVSYSHLTRHRKIHSGVRPHICAVCGRAFVRACHLSRHEKSLHGPKV